MCAEEKVPKPKLITISLSSGRLVFNYRHKQRKKTTKKVNSAFLSLDVS